VISKLCHFGTKCIPNDTEKKFELRSARNVIQRIIEQEIRRIAKKREHYPHRDSRLLRKWITVPIGEINNAGRHNVFLRKIFKSRFKVCSSAVLGMKLEIKNINSLKIANFGIYIDDLDLSARIDWLNFINRIHNTDFLLSQFN